MTCRCGPWISQPRCTSAWRGPPRRSPPQHPGRLAVRDRRRRRTPAIHRQVGARRLGWRHALSQEHFDQPRSLELARGEYPEHAATADPHVFGLEKAAFQPLLDGRPAGPADSHNSAVVMPEIYIARRLRAQALGALSPRSGHSRSRTASTVRRFLHRSNIAGYSIPLRRSECYTQRNHERNHDIFLRRQTEVG